MDNLIMSSATVGIVISLLAYEIGLAAQRKWKLALLNPLLISIAIVIAFLVVFHVDYESYNMSAKYLSYLLTPYKPTPVTEQMEKDFFTIVKERRSVREFKDKEVPDELIDKILEAGLWAAHGCNIQSIRYVVVREKNEPGLFRGSDVPGGPVHLVILQDMRCYRANSFTPVRNQLLDAGAAGQNIVLAAHAVGLEGVWLTFPGEEFCDRLRKKFNLPDYIRLVTYVDVGYGDQTPYPPQRWDVKDTILGRY